jgi:hypothetical protein
LTLIDHYQPSDSAVCAAFNLTQDELDTARILRAAGTFTTDPTFDVTPYQNVFTNAVQAIDQQPRIIGMGKPDMYPTTKDMIDAGDSSYGPRGSATIHARPESASKRVREPQKRGRKGDKIKQALCAVPTTPVPVDDFIKQYNISLAVLRQAKRFIEKFDETTVRQIGKINVRQDKVSKQLLIWREVE